MNGRLLAPLASLMVGLHAVAQETNSFPLWPDGAPGALGKGTNDTPTLTVFLPVPEKATGAAFVICPGGGYGHLADHEGSHYAHWFNEQGIAGFVLKYRLGTAGYRHPAMLQDASRALRTVRARAEEWKLDSKRIGIIGSSAGGHLASTMLTHFDAGKADAADPIERASSRPDLAILCYPVITLTDPNVHKGSRANLLGTNPPPELVKELSAELQVTKDSPPCFIWHTWEDKVVPVENSLNLAAALKKVGVPFDLHIYERGPHGMGLGSRVYGGGERHPWTHDAEFWLREHQFGNPSEHQYVNPLRIPTRSLKVPRSPEEEQELVRKIRAKLDAASEANGIKPPPPPRPDTPSAISPPPPLSLSTNKNQQP